MSIAMGVKRLQVHIDSQLVTCQVSGDYKARDGRMATYQEIVKKLIQRFEQVYVKLIPRDSNSQADALAHLATSEGPVEIKDVTITKLSHPSHSLIASLEPPIETESWMTPIVKYLQNDDLPQDRTKARQLQMRAARYTLIGTDLYKQGFGTPLLKCITPEQGQAILKDIHEGVCGNHAGGNC